jgi:hypothetical protein
MGPYARLVIGMPCNRAIMARRASRIGCLPRSTGQSAKRTVAATGPTAAAACTVRGLGVIQNSEFFERAASLIGSTDEQTMRWFILVVALLLDPAAVLLLLAATRRP